MNHTGEDRALLKLHNRHAAPVCSFVVIAGNNKDRQRAIVAGSDSIHGARVAANTYSEDSAIIYQRESDGSWTQVKP